MNDSIKLNVENISLILQERGRFLTLLDHVSLKIRQGRIHALLGPSGSGKSTLLYTLNRLRQISEGEIYLDNTETRSLNILDLRRRVGLVMQKAIFFSGTVSDNILYGPRIQDKELPDPFHYLELVGLNPDFTNRDPNTLSGGQQQRVSIARALANDPEVLLLDEPTSALDAQASEHLEEVVMQLCQECQLTVVWVTHDLHQARRVAQDVTLLYRGQMLEQGEAADFFAQPITVEGRAYLDGRLGGVE
ncbi:phosphate ABC transporter ATP-binding protein [Desulfitobacterium sp.]|uniref:ABC transporter ATP-binding protein n=1 Tax=Desulfitobacterium sp. TaxID=49981 RepID=UPI002D11D717|nr:phosphate ABC transporter ATP-binding protein [Desulfitobacterium sp.]HVJ48551.1 phosphate ABC transporter ATP-binding protein [Desulfitobacterium sp.]